MRHFGLNVFLTFLRLWYQVSSRRSSECSMRLFWFAAEAVRNRSKADWN